VLGAIQAATLPGHAGILLCRVQIGAVVAEEAVGSADAVGAGKGQALLIVFQVRRAAVS